MKLRASPRLGELYTTHPENPGLASLAMGVDVPVNIREAYRLQQVIEKKRIGLVVIGPEDPLAEGFADKLVSPTCKVFGPTRAGAMIEADKAWAKQIMRSAAVPTADGRTFSDVESARQYMESRVRDEPVLAAMFEAADAYRDPSERRKYIDRQRETMRDVARAYATPHADLPVIKAAGLAKGKGVVVPTTLGEALATLEQFMVRRIFGEAGTKVVIEEKLSGPEVSVLAITDGASILVLPPAQDHKRLRDNDQGPNTGGMGAVCPGGAIDATLMDTIEREVLVPTVDALKREGIAYTGVLFAGLMLTPAGPRVLEFNCRFGDPECEAIIVRLRSDLLELMLAACDGRLGEVDVAWDSRPSCCVVLASEGYPEKPRMGVPITGLDAAAALPDVFVFHAGTKRRPDGTIVTNGGRVLAITALGETIEQARARAYEACAVVGFEGKHMRSDIGQPRPAVGV